MVNHRLLALALGLSFAAPNASAQRLVSPMKSWTASIDAVGHPTSTISLQARTRDYRVEGAIVGGLIFGVLGYWVGYQSCKDQPQPVGPNGNDCNHDALVVGAVLGGVGVGLGYFVGRSIDR